MSERISPIAKILTCMVACMAFLSQSASAPNGRDASSAHDTMTFSCTEIPPAKSLNSHFIDFLSESCRIAMIEHAMESPTSANAAERYLGHLATLTRAFSDLGQHPSDAGAYLIARDLGVLDALHEWSAARADAGGVK